MNRRARRAARKVDLTAGRLEHPIPDSVTLRGGPMAGWIVSLEAPVLRPDWWSTVDPLISPEIHRHFTPGRYERRGREAFWVATA